MILLLILLVMTLALFCLCVVRAQRRRALPPLRGDWWPQFERQFREYSARVGEDRPQAS